MLAGVASGADDVLPTMLAAGHLEASVAAVPGPTQLALWSALTVDAVVRPTVLVPFPTWLPIVEGCRCCFQRLARNRVATVILGNVVPSASYPLDPWTEK